MRCNFCPGLLARAASHHVVSPVRERSPPDGKTASGYSEVAQRRFRILCCMLSYLEGIGLIGVNRTARRVPVALDNALATICPLSLIAMAELRWYVSAAAPISLLRFVIVP